MHSVQLAVYALYPTVENLLAGKMEEGRNCSLYNDRHDAWKIIDSLAGVKIEESSYTALVCSFLYVE